MINKEMKAADLASVTGGGWKTNLAIGGLCLASGPIGTMVCLGAYNGLHGLCEIKERTYEQ